MVEDKLDLTHDKHSKPVKSFRGGCLYSHQLQPRVVNSKQSPRMKSSRQNWTLLLRNSSPLDSECLTVLVKVLLFYLARSFQCCQPYIRYFSFQDSVVHAPFRSDRFFRVESDYDYLRWFRSRPDLQSSVSKAASIGFVQLIVPFSIFLFYSGVLRRISFWQKGRCDAKMHMQRF